jgi:spore coat polysaccharide biosynthesis protein SpsF (cytidylyltransferase family)
MKNSFLIIISAIVLTSCASKTSFNSFYVENKEECEFSISSPAFLANLFIPRDDVKEYEDLFKKVRHYKVMIFSNTSKDLDKRFNRFIKKKKYESIIRINQDGEQVQLYFLQHKNTIREIVLKVKSDNDYVLLGLKTNISENDLNSIIEKSTYDVSSN